MGNILETITGKRARDEEELQARNRKLLVSREVSTPQ
jgi:hypothetical protein